MKTILVLNGPNLNLLGKRQPEIYGHETLDDVARMCRAACGTGFAIDLKQSNHEGQLIDWIHAARETTCGLVINPGALTEHLRTAGDRGPHQPGPQARGLPAPLLRLVAR
jgi:3-dehydroquinate dehydratase-2